MSTMPPPRPAYHTIDVDFEEVKPSEGYKDEYGSPQWTGPHLDYIEENGVAKHTLASLPARMQLLMKQLWDVQPSAEAGRSNIVIGQGSQGWSSAPGRAQAHAQRLGRPWDRPMTPAEVIAQGAYRERTAPYVKRGQLLQGKTADQAGESARITANGYKWDTHADFELVNAYTFRGDTRPPEKIRAVDGFQPPYTRTDQWYIENVIYPNFKWYMSQRFKKDVDKAAFDKVYNKTVGADAMLVRNYFVWMNLLEMESFHAGKMVADETLKGYISSSKATGVAKGFAGNAGWVYVLLIKGGFLLPSKGTHNWTKMFGEEEIAFPGKVPWSDIFGFRQVAGYHFTGPIHMRRGFQARNLKAYKEVYELLSGKPQR